MVYVMLLMNLFIRNAQISLHRTLIDGLECGLLVDYCDVFYQLSFWRHPFTAEDPLVSKWCNAKFHQNKHIYILDGLQVVKS